MEQPVKDEITFQRDMKLLRRHRKWGWNVPAVDIDFLEYDERKAVALVEYKKAQSPGASAVDFKQANIQAFIDLGNRASIPVFCVFYTPDLKWYRVLPLNNIAVRRDPPVGIITEQRYVDFLYRLRGRDVPHWVRL